MVSGLVTSPCDQLRIFSGDARLMRIASKSAIGFAISKGLERYKVFLHSCSRWQWPGDDWPVASLCFASAESERRTKRFLQIPCQTGCRWRSLLITDHRQLV